MKPVPFVFICVMLASTLALAQNPIPFVNQPLVPDATAPGGPDFTLTVNGTGFVVGATVNWNGTALATTFVDGSHLTATVPAPDIATAGTAIVTVTNPAPGGGTSGVLYLSVSDSRTGIAFAPPVTYDSGGQFQSAVVMADVNGDGKPDLLVVNQCPTGQTSCFNASGSIGVLLGNGDGTFRPAVTYDSGGTFVNGCVPSCNFFTSSLAVADVNGDGKLDLLVASNGGAGNGDGLVGVLLGNGDGTFQPAVTYDSGGITASAVAAADVNGDGKLDLLVTNECKDQNCPVDETDDGSVGVILGNGDGTFQAPLTYDAGGTTTASVAVADLDRDGRLDLVVADSCGTNPLCVASAAGVLLGNGDGTFQPVVTYNPGGVLSYSAVVADVNGDGKQDVLVASGSTPDGTSPDAPVSVFLGNGDGTLQPVVDYGMGGTRTRSLVAVGDLNGDRGPDLVVTLNCTPDVCPAGRLSVLPGNGDGTFQTAVLFPASKINAQSVALADVNGDGKPDALVSICLNSQCTQGGVVVLLNTLPTTTTLTSSTNPSLVGESVTFTAAITQQGKGTPTGTVTFLDDTTKLGIVPLNDSGKAVLSISTIALGNRSITAAYSGDATFAASTSSVVIQVVQDFDLVMNVTSQTVASGQTANFPGVVSPVDGFNKSLSLSCSGSPANSTCSVTPNAITLDGSNSVNLNVAVVTQGTGMAATQSMHGPHGVGARALAVWSGVIGGLLLGACYSQRRLGRSPWKCGLALLCLLAIVGMPACGGGQSGNGGGRTQTGTYTLTVTAAFNAGSSQVTRTAKVTLVVK